MIDKYRRLRTFKAMQWTGENDWEIRNFCHTVKDVPAMLPSLIILTGSGSQVVCSPDDWILWDGEDYTVFNTTIETKFEHLYMRVDDAAIRKDRRLRTALDELPVEVRRLISFMSEGECPCDLETGPHMPECLALTAVEEAIEKIEHVTRSKAT